MTANTQKQFKRTIEAFARIDIGKKFQIPTRKWINPVDMNLRGLLRVDGRTTTLRSFQPLEHRTHQWTADDVHLLCAVLQDSRQPKRFWLWVWDNERGVHVVEPAGTDVEALDKDLAEWFPNP